jgi:hypothetical protein
MGIMRKALRLVLPTIVAASALGQTPIASALTRSSTIVGEVRVIPPERHHKRHQKKHAPQKVMVKVPLTVEDVRSGKVVRRKTVLTDTKFVLSITPGAYRVSAKLGAPLIGPLPKECGPLVVNARAGRRVVVKLYCVVV